MILTYCTFVPYKNHLISVINFAANIYVKFFTALGHIKFIVENINGENSSGEML